MLNNIFSGKNTLNPNNRSPCFELFGYDFMIDEDFRCWLLEINTNPYLGLPNAFIKQRKLFIFTYLYQYKFLLY